MNLQELPYAELKERAAQMSPRELYALEVLPAATLAMLAEDLAAELPAARVTDFLLELLKDGRRLVREGATLALASSSQELT
jgi:hypothetical protein